MKQVMRLVTRTSARESTTLKTALQTYNNKHRGLTGNAAIRERDWQYMWATRPPIGIIRPDGKRIWPAHVVQDASEALDWLLPTAGSLLVRTAEGWRPSGPAAPGAVCRLASDAVAPGCSPPAQYSTDVEQIGGYGP